MSSVKKDQYRSNTLKTFLNRENDLNQKIEKD